MATGDKGFVEANIVNCLVCHGHQLISFAANRPDQLLVNFVEGASANITLIDGEIVGGESETAW